MWMKFIRINNPITIEVLRRDHAKKINKGYL